MVLPPMSFPIAMGGTTLGTVCVCGQEDFIADTHDELVLQLIAQRETKGSCTARMNAVSRDVIPR